TDGMDGLAAGLSIIAVGATALFLPGAPAGERAVAMALCGALGAFLVFNRYPARVFMGDTGALAIGFLLAAMAIQQGALLLLVIGAARGGVALALHLAAQGEEVRLADRKPLNELQSTIAQLPPGVDVRAGGYDERVLDGVDVVYASPGVPWDSDLLNQARARGIQVSSEIVLFLGLCRGTVVGITGTNGKTTTTALTGDVLAAGERPVLVGGNIGDTVLDRVDEITPQHWVVLELSSFQLESVQRPHLHVGVILNITPDHLDRHRTLERYVDLKARAIEDADQALLNSRDALVSGLARRARGQVLWFDRHQPQPPMPLPGRHNMENALAAAAIGRIAG